MQKTASGEAVNISDVARKTGLTAKAIRFYEQKAIITPPLRCENGYRSYDLKHIEELTLLCQARQIGFTLDECRELVRLFNDPQRHSAEVKARTMKKITEIEQRIIELENMRQRLFTLAAQCPGNEKADCPIIKKLAGVGSGSDQ